MKTLKKLAKLVAAGGVGFAVALVTGSPLMAMVAGGVVAGLLGGFDS